MKQGESTMKKGMLAAVLLVIALLVSACSGSPSGGTANEAPANSDNTTANSGEISGDIDVWLYTDNVIQDPIKKLLPEFNKKYPKVKVNIIPVNGSDTAAKFMSAVSSGKGVPDVLQTSDNYAHLFAMQGALHDVSDRMAPYVDQMVPWKLEMGNQDGKYYSIPWDGAVTVMYYRKDVFEQYGIKAEDLTTWDKFTEAGKTLLEKSGGKVKMINLPVGSTGDKAGLNYIYEEMSHQLGGSLFGEDQTSTVNSKENVRVLEKLRSMVGAGISSNVQPWSPEEFGQWQDGSVATVINASWLKGSIESQAPDTSGKWGIMLPPSFDEGGNPYSSYISSQMVFPNKSKKLDAGWAFSEFYLLNKDIVTQTYKMGAPFPALKSAYDDPAFKQPEKFWSDQPVGELLADSEPKVPIKHLVASNWEQLMNNVLPQFLFDAVQEGSDIPAILDKAKKALEEEAQF
jgi:ABC-type glycerol-3-phosphate transport system substrate-binding protein